MARPQRTAQNALTSGRPSAATLPWRRPVLAAGLLLAEYVFVSVTFNADALRLRGGWWSGLGLVDPLGAVLLVTLAASLLAGAATIRSAAAELAALLRAPQPLGPAMAVHAIAFALFVAVTGYAFGASFTLATRPGMWVAAWTVLGAAVVTSAAAIAVPLNSAGDLLRRVRRPLAIGVAIGAIAWIAGRTTGELWWVLSRGTFESVAAVLRLTGQHVVAQPDGFQLGIDEYTVTIASSCAGYEGIGVIVVFLGAFLWLERGQLRFPRAWLLLPIGVTAILAANVLRIASLVLVGRWVSPAIAEGSFHSKAGWVLYCAIALGMVTMARRSPLVMRSSAPVADDTWNPTAVYLGPLLALIATALVTGLFTAEFDYFYPLRVVVVGAVLWRSRRLLPLRWEWPAWHAIGLGIVVFALWLALEPRSDAARIAAWHAQLDTLAPTTGALWLAFRIVGSVLTVPIAEELAFRGYLLRRLIGPDFTEVSPRLFTWSSFLISSLAFGALHQRWVAGTIAGGCYALAQQRRGSLSDAVTAHALTNALIAADVLVAGAWWLWL